MHLGLVLVVLPPLELDGHPPPAKPKVDLHPPFTHAQREPFRPHIAPEIPVIHGETKYALQRPLADTSDFTPNVSHFMHHHTFHVRRHPRHDQGRSEPFPVEFYRPFVLDQRAHGAPQRLRREPQLFHVLCDGVHRRPIQARPNEHRRLVQSHVAKQLRNHHRLDDLPQRHPSGNHWYKDRPAADPRPRGSVRGPFSMRSPDSLLDFAVFFDAAADRQLSRRAGSRHEHERATPHHWIELSYFPPFLECSLPSRPHSSTPGRAPGPSARHPHARAGTPP